MTNLAVRNATERWGRLVRPREDGSPNTRVAAIFPSIIAALFVILVAFGISGTSSGAYWHLFGGNTDDPALISGEPRNIRSDEWFVQSGWIVSQYAGDFDETNQSFPGGADSTIQNDVPSLDWSTVFRPHVAGFLALPLDQGMAVRWWLPAGALIAGIYLFVVTLLPRRPITAGALAVGAYLSPLLQWWFLPTTLYPVAWAFFGMTAIIWLVRFHRKRAALVLTVVTAYLTVTLAMSIYVPFIVPAALVLVIMGVAEILRGRGVLGSWRAVLRRVLPLAIAWVGSIVVLGLWVATRLKTVESVLGTVYPGTRLSPPGQVDAAGAVSLLAAPFNLSLADGYAGVLGPNQSEASTAVPFALLFIVPVVWLVWKRWHDDRKVAWLSVGYLVAVVVAVAYWFLPGWDLLAHLSGLDRSQPSRMRLVLVILAVVGFVLIARELDKGRVRLPMSVVWSTAAIAVVYLASLAIYFAVVDPGVITHAANWRWAALLIIGVVVLLLLRRIALAAIAFLLVGIIIGGSVNPLYVGVIDLATDTKIGKAVRQIDESSPGAWLAIADGARSDITVNLGSNVLFETGVETYGGMQTYPSKEMWADIDPQDQYENAWNRLAQTYWHLGSGEPVVESPFPDQISVTFDSCSSFAQENVAHVMSESTIDQACVELNRTVKQGETTFYIWDVVPSN